MIIFAKRTIFKIVTAILIVAVSFSILPQNSMAVARSLDSVFSVADYRIFNKLNSFSPDKELLSILEEFYLETEEALVRMDTEKYDSSEISTFAGGLKMTLEMVLKKTKAYNGDSAYRDAIIEITEDYVALLDKVVLKAKGLDPSNPTTPGFHNFDFSQKGIDFADVPSGIWYENDVDKLSGAGIFKGTGNNQFSPNKVLTKAEAMALTARINAIYHGRLYDLERMISANTASWKQAVLDYCIKYEVALFYPRDFDSVCNRNDIAYLIMGSLPKETFTFKNSTFDIPYHNERIGFTAQETLLLFVYGICMGNGESLDGRGELTRAQAAALIYRCANPDARITLRDNVYIPERLISKYPDFYSYMKADNSTKAYKRVYQIFGTKWGEGARDLTGNVNTLPTNEYSTYLKYGNGHYYFTANQQEYEFVTNTAIEAFNYANNPLGIKEEHYFWLKTYYNKDKKKIPIITSYALGEISYQEMLDLYFDENSRKKYDEFKKTFGFTSDTDLFNLIRLYETAGLMQAYLSDIATANRVPNAEQFSRRVSDSLGSAGYALNESYLYLTKGMPLDCDGNSTIEMLTFDTLGFSTRMLSADYVNHAIPEIYIGDRWMCMDDNRHQFTHEELLYDIATMNPKTCNNQTTNNLYVQGAATDLWVSISPTHTTFHE